VKRLRTRNDLKGANETARPLSFSSLKPRAFVEAARKQQNDKLTRRRKPEAQWSEERAERRRRAVGDRVQRLVLLLSVSICAFLYAA
jgi:hypothetical protein